MKILALRGENLASLSRAFAIDFTNTPLNGAGLFAITGETGAGKSTLLDALCLALYGRYPRLEFSSAESILDINGDQLRTNDQRHILRKGAGSGYAEVEFEATDGLTYRARWDVRRSNEKPGGKLQAEKLSLSRATDGKTIATKVKEVSQHVESLTGLTFEQFRRTCLLAQGQFDAFLVAKENDRAALLERITGTEIYSLVSAIVFQRTSGHRQTVAVLEDNLKQQPVLSVEERQKIEKTLDTLSQLVRLQEDAVAKHQASLMHLTNQTNSLLELSSAQVTEHNAAAAVAARSEDRALLAAVDKVESLRTHANHLSQAQQADNEASVATEAASRTAEEKERETNLATDRLAETLRQKTACDLLVDSLILQWQLAEALDVSLQHADADGRAAQDLLTAKQNRHAALAKSSAEQFANATQIRDRLAELAGWLDARKPQASVAAQLPNVNSLFAARTGLHTKLGTAAAARTRLETEKLAADAEAAATIKEISKYTQELAALAQTIGACVDRMNAIPRAALDQQQQEIRSVARWLEEAKTHCTDALKAESSATSHRAQATSLSEKRTHFAEHVETLKKQLAITEGALGEAVRLNDRAHLTTSKAAEELRTRLIPGEPCAVCGSHNHPFVEMNADFALLAAETERRRAELAFRQSELAQSLTEIQGERATANSQFIFHSQQANDAETERTRQSEVFQNTVPHLPADIPSTISPATRDAIEARLLALKDELTSVVTQLDLYTTLNDERTGLLSRQVDTEQRKSALNQNLQQQLATTANLQARLAQVEAEITSTQEQLIANADQLTPLLEPFSISITQLDAQPDRQSTFVRTAVNDYIQKREAAEESKTKLAEAETALSAVRAECSAAESNVREAAADAESKRQTLRRIQTERAAVLGGEPVSTHRQRHLSQQTTAQQGHLQANQAVSKAEAAMDAAIDQQRACQMAQEGIANALASAKEAFESACMRLEIEPVRVMELLAIPIQRTQQLRLELTSLEQVCHTAANARAAAEQKHTEATNACIGLPSESDLKTARQNAEEARNTALQQLGAERQKLEEDKTHQQAAAKIKADLETATTQYNVWQDVNTAIGSAQGDKFRKFVQSLTLDNLVHLANHHLKSFAPRYRLARAANEELTLQIIDCEMADSIRPVSTLSGGERFLTSLGLALALSGLEGKDAFVDTLFIDEGFGSLDAESLDLVMAALETLPSSGRRVGVITHVAAMMDRIAVQVRVRKQGNGRSSIDIVDATVDNAILFAARA